MTKERVFVDANIIIAAFRTNSWKALCNAYQAETAAKCVEEVLRGDPSKPGYVKVDETQLRKGLHTVHEPTPLQLATFQLERVESQGLDDGEKHLLAQMYAMGLTEEVHLLLSTSDKAAVVSAAKVGWIDRLVSLEHMLEKSGVTRGQIRSLDSWFSKRWLDGIKADLRTGLL